MKIVLLLLALAACTKHGMEGRYIQISVTKYTCMEVFPRKDSNILAMLDSLDDANKFCDQQRKEKGL